MTTRPNAHDHSDGYPLRASGRYPLTVDSGAQCRCANAAACRVMWTIRDLRIRPPYEAIEPLTSPAGASALADNR